jgi:hypothetical protein
MLFHINMLVQLLILLIQLTIHYFLTNKVKIDCYQIKQNNLK